MACCQKCVKIYVMFVSALVICCGITLLFVTQFAMNLEDYVPSDDFADWIKYFKMALMILAGIIIEIGILGVFSAWKQNKCVIVLFELQITFFSLIFLVIGVIAIAIVQSTINKIDCANLDILGDSSDVISKSMNLICTAECPCNCQNSEVLQILATRTSTSTSTSNTDLATTLSNLLSGNLGGTSVTPTSPTTTTTLNYVVSASGVVRVQDCPTFESTVGSYDVITKAFGKLEEKFDCSGLCSVSKIYLFSDINNGIPQGECLQKIVDQMKKLLNLLGIVGLTLGSVLFITIFVSCWLCCKEKQKSQKVMDYNNVDAKSAETPHQPQQQNYQMQQYY